MKLSDYVALFIRDAGIRHVFGLTGGAAAHLIDSAAETDGLDFICAQHEQGAAMMADAYARVNGIGATIATSGPGASNLLTGTGCSFFDSVPVVNITGQVSTFRLRRDSGVRQLGFQEADTVDLFRPLTKHATMLEKKEDVRFELERAFFIAASGRPGPVLLDIPDNLQREDIGDPSSLRRFVPGEVPAEPPVDPDALSSLLRSIRSASRPLLVLGWGVRLAGAEQSVPRLLELLGIPFVLTWGALDLAGRDHPLYAGTFGTHGSRSGNFAVQNADLILSIGSRLDTHHTGTPATFAREARLAIVDIDNREIEKFNRYGRPCAYAFDCDAGRFINAMNSVLEKDGNVSVAPAAWRGHIRETRTKYTPPIRHGGDDEAVSPYALFAMLSSWLGKDDLLFADTGCSLAWLMQTFHPAAGQRVLSAFNYTPMGYALPAAVGGAFASGKRCFCISGDGGMQINAQEMSVCVKHDLDCKILLFSNNGYGMIQQTQEQWLGSRYHASTLAGGLAFPDFAKLAEAYGFAAVEMRRNADIEKAMASLVARPGPGLCVVHVPDAARVEPQLKFGFPLEDQEPHLPRNELRAAMLVPLLPESANLAE